MSQPFISVVMPVYKVENYLRAAVESLLKQTFTDYEIILVGHRGRAGTRVRVCACDP